MKGTATLLCAALLVSAAGYSFSAAPTDDASVLAQDLTALRVSKRVSAALWTRRPDSYTLQLVLWAGGWAGDPLFGTRTLMQVDGRRMVSAPAVTTVQAPSPAGPETSVWLLRADGTQIATRGSSTNPSRQNCTGRCMAVDVLYRFPIADAKQAVAVAVRIGDEYYIEKLQSLEPPTAK